MLTSVRARIEAATLDPRTRVVYLFKMKLSLIGDLSRGGLGRKLQTESRKSISRRFSGSRNCRRGHMYVRSENLATIQGKKYVVIWARGPTNIMTIKPIGTRFNKYSRLQRALTKIIDLGKIDRPVQEIIFSRSDKEHELSQSI